MVNVMLRMKSIPCSLCIDGRKGIGVHIEAQDLAQLTLDALRVRSDGTIAHGRKRYPSEPNPIRPPRWFVVEEG
jgi:hypothetical protein